MRYWLRGESPWFGKNDSDRRPGNGQSALTLPFSRIAHAVDSAIPTNQTKRLSGAPVQLTVVVAAPTYARRGR